MRDKLPLPGGDELRLTVVTDSTVGLKSDVPHASVRTACTPSSFARRFRNAADLAELRLEYDLPPDPAVEMPFRYLHLACEPPGFSPPDEAPAPTSHLLQPSAADRLSGEPLAALIERLAVERRPLVTTA